MFNHSAVVIASEKVISYQYLFQNYSNTKRYAKHQFHHYSAQLHEIGDGILHGYSQGDRQLLEVMQQELYLQLFALTMWQYHVLQRPEIDMETEIRMGTREEIRSRNRSLLSELEIMQF